MFLISLCSIIHVVCIHAISDKLRATLCGLGVVLLLQVSSPYLFVTLPYSTPHPTQLTIPDLFFAFSILNHFAALSDPRHPCIITSPDTDTDMDPLKKVDKGKGKAKAADLIEEPDPRVC